MMMHFLVQRTTALMPEYTIRVVETKQGPCIQASKGSHVVLLSPTCIRNAPGIVKKIKATPCPPQGKVREWVRGHLVIAIDHLDTDTM